MRSVVVSIFLVVVPQAHADVLAEGYVGESQDAMLADKSGDLVQSFVDTTLDKMVSNIFGRGTKASRYHQTGLDRTALGKGEASTVFGKTIGDGKYLLCTNPQRSSSGKSEIYRGYQRGTNEEPVGPKLAFKISSNPKTMSHESGNYDRMASSEFPGSFVKKVDFLPKLNNAGKSSFDEQCALVMECGQADVQDILKQRGGKGLEGSALRDAAKGAADCVQAMHTSGFVWTDLKPPNFVVVGDEIGDASPTLEVKGVDVENANPYQSNPIAYSPEACPPEFAVAITEGKEGKFVLDYSYDIWSYGMYLYELALGKSYWEVKNGAQFRFMGREVVIEIMAERGFRVDVSDVKDDKLRDLIQQCLSVDPKKRPAISEVVAHPYFVAG